MNIKFKKFANLEWMKDQFNVHASELMDFQMMSDEAGIGMAAFHQPGNLRLIVFKYEQEDKQMTNFWHQDFDHDFINVREPGAEVKASFHASNAENHNYQLIVKNGQAKIYYLSTAQDGNGALSCIEISGKLEGGQLSGVRFSYQLFPISNKVKAVL